MYTTNSDGIFQSWRLGNNAKSIDRGDWRASLVVAQLPCFLPTAMSEALNLKFVSEVEKWPVLYNYNLKGYSKKDVTEKAWNDVAEEMQLSGEFYKIV